MSFYYVKIHYGPCRSVYNVVYNPWKLKGIRVALQKYGYRVDFEPVKWQDYCMLEVCGHEVFRCNVQNLKCNTCVERDPIAERAVQAVLDGTRRTLRARSYLWKCEWLEHHIFSNEYAPKDFFLPTINIEPLEDFKAKLNIKRCQKQLKQLQTIREEKSDEYDNRDDEELLSLSLLAPPPSSNKEDDEYSDVDDGKVDVDANEGEVNNEIWICDCDNDVDEMNY